MSCRINKKREWTGKLLLESLNHPADSNLFCTFTYEDAQVPITKWGELTLNKTDGVAFRNILKLRFGRQVRFFWVGEYGDQTQRPHYHAVLYGLNQMEHTSLLDKTWTKGNIMVSTLNVTRAGYMAKYVTKRMTNPDDPRLEEGERHPEYAQMSRLPALGDHYITALADWYTTRKGAAKLAHEGDVATQFRYQGRIYPISQRQARNLRKLVGIPEKRTDLKKLNPEAFPEAELPDAEEITQRRKQEMKIAKKEALYKTARRSI